MNNKPSLKSQRPRELVDAAKTSPSSVYDHPREVVQSHVLTPQQKAEILDQWEADAIALQTASDEGMTGGAPSRLDDVQKAKSKLAEATSGHGAPHSALVPGQRTGIVTPPSSSSTVDNPYRGANDDNRPDEEKTVLSGRDARSGVTGNNVRYVLAISLLGVIVAFFLVGRYIGSF